VVVADKRLAFINWQGSRGGANANKSKKNSLDNSCKLFGKKL
jgi:hypothetical protein